MIWAVEASDRFGRLTCSECTDRLRSQRGCNKPGFDVKGQTVFRSTSPYLAQKGKPSELRTCPVGEVLSKAPYVYDAIMLASHVENGAVDPTKLSHYAQRTIQLVQSERARLRELNGKSSQGKDDAAYARQVLNG